MKLEIRQLKAFLTVAKELHFGKAAQQLDISQPLLSQQIQKLESAIGAPLFERTTRTVRLTQAGLVLRGPLTDVLRQLDKIIGDAQRAANGEVGEMTVGFAASVAHFLLPQILYAYRQRYPEIKLALKELHSAVLIEQLQSHQIDVALLRPDKSAPDVVLKPIAQESLWVAVPTHHPLASRESLLLSDLQGEPFIGFSKTGSRYFHNLIKRLAIREGVELNVVQESLLPTMFVLVEAEIGLCIVPASATGMHSSGIVYLPLKSEKAPLTATLMIASLRSNETMAVHNFIDLAHQHGHKAKTLQ